MSAASQGGSGRVPQGIATLRAEQERGVAASPAEEKQKTDLINQQANESIQKTQRETAAPPSGGSVGRSP
jgi:hypothetical protein